MLIGLSYSRVLKLQKIFFFAVIGIVALAFVGIDDAYAVTVNPGTFIGNSHTNYTADVSPNFNVTSITVSPNYIYLGTHYFNLTSTSGQVEANVTGFHENNNMTLHLTSSFGNVHLFVLGQVAAVQLSGTFYPYGTNWQYINSNTVTDVVVGAHHDVFITFNGTGSNIHLSSFSLTGFVSNTVGTFNYPKIILQSPTNANVTDMALFESGVIVAPIKHFSPPFPLLANTTTQIPWSFRDVQAPDTTRTYNVEAIIQSGNDAIISSTNSITMTFGTHVPLLQCKSQLGSCYSFHRLNNFTQLNLFVNETVVPFHINIRMVNATFNQTVVWHNYTSINGLNATYNVLPNDFAYGAGFGSGQLFSFSSPGNGSSLAGGIGYLDSTFGGFLGVPMGVFFLLIVSGLATGKTAPTVFVIMLATAAILGALGFFVINQGVWGLCLIAAALALFAGRKVF